MQTVILIVGVLVIAALALLGWMMYKMTHRGLSKSTVAKIEAMFARADHAGTPAMRILEYDKVLDHMLFELGFKGSTGEKLTKAGARFSNKDALWRGHKLRNVVAHEQGATASGTDADHFRNSLLHAFKQIS